MRLAGGLMLASSVAILAACSAKPGGDTPVGEEIPCDLASNRTWAEKCRMEQVTKGDARFLVIHHPDGAFRRLELLKASPWLATADGAVPLVWSPKGPYIDVFVANKGYRLPESLRYVREY